MPYVNTLDLVTAARGMGYAVPAINIIDPLTIKAVVEAADLVDGRHSYWALKHPADRKSVV